MVSDEGHFRLIDVGIDIGMRRLAYAWPAYRLAGSIDLSKQNLSRDKELRMLQDWLVTKLPEGVQLWIDQAYSQASIATAQRLTETISAVLTTQEWLCEPIIVHASTWKSQVLGNHRADKDEIRQYVEDHHPKLAAVCHTEDEYDAMVIGIYGRERGEGRILPPEPKPKKRRKTRT